MQRDGAGTPATGYALNHSDGLVRFLDDGRGDLDTDFVERALRRVAPSGKNALPAGSDDGAENSAAVTSSVETCKLIASIGSAILSDG